MEKIPIKFDYDKQGDVLYITIDPTEPSYCEEVDDILLVERGIITNRITGFRVLDVRHHKIQQVQVTIVQMIKKEELPFKDILIDNLKKRFETDKALKSIYAS